MALPRLNEIIDDYRYIGGDVNDQSSWQSADAPKQGDILDGYVFKGGNPNEQASWELDKPTAKHKGGLLRSIADSYNSGIEALNRRSRLENSVMEGKDGAVSSKDSQFSHANDYEDMPVLRDEVKNQAILRQNEEAENQASPKIKGIPVRKGYADKVEAEMAALPADLKAREAKRGELKGRVSTEFKDTPDSLAPAIRQALKASDTELKSRDDYSSEDWDTTRSQAYGSLSVNPKITQESLEQEDKEFNEAARRFEVAVVSKDNNVAQNGLWAGAKNGLAGTASALMSYLPDESNTAIGLNKYADRQRADAGIIANNTPNSSIDYDQLNQDNIGDYVAWQLSNNAANVVGYIGNKPLQVGYLTHVATSVYGNKFAEGEQINLPEGLNRARATGHALGEVATEFLPIAAVGKLVGIRVPDGVKNKILKRVAITSGAIIGAPILEGLEESTSSVWGAFIDNLLANNPNITKQQQGALKSPVFDKKRELNAFASGAAGGAVGGGVAAVSANVREQSLDRAEKSINYTLNTDSHLKLDNQQLANARNMAAQINKERPNSVDINKFDDEINNRKQSSVIDEITQQQQKADVALENITNPNTSIDQAIELAKTATDTPLVSTDTALLDEINASQAVDAIPATDLLESENVSAINPTTILAAGTSRLVDTEQSGSAADTLLQPVDSTNGRLDNNATTLAQSSESADVLRTDDIANGALIAPGEVQAKMDMGSGAIVSSNGEPYKTERGAQLALKGKRLEGQYEVAPVDGGFSLVKTEKVSQTALPQNDNAVDELPNDTLASKEQFADTGKVISNNSNKLNLEAIDKLPSVNNTDGTPTGWKRLQGDNNDSVTLISNDGAKSVFFENTNKKSGTEAMRMNAKADAFAIDNQYIQDLPEPLPQGELVSKPIFKNNTAKTTKTATANPLFEKNRATIEALAPRMNWGTIGNKRIDDAQGNQIGRSKFVPIDDAMEELRKQGTLSYNGMREAVAKALAGKPLSSAEKRTIDLIADYAENNDVAISQPITDEQVAKLQAAREADPEGTFDELVYGKIDTPQAKIAVTELSDDALDGGIGKVISTEEFEAWLNAEGTNNEQKTDNERTETPTGRDDTSRETGTDRENPQGNRADGNQQQSAPVKPQENQAAKTIVDKLIGLKTAAKQLRKPNEKYFDNHFDNAIKLAQGKNVTPTALKLSSLRFAPKSSLNNETEREYQALVKADLYNKKKTKKNLESRERLEYLKTQRIVSGGNKELSDLFLQLFDIAKNTYTPIAEEVEKNNASKAKSQSQKSSYAQYQTAIANATTLDALQTLAGQIQRDNNLTDKQATDLDDAVFDAQDALEVEEPLSQPKTEESPEAAPVKAEVKAVGKNSVTESINAEIIKTAKRYGIDPDILLNIASQAKASGNILVDHYTSDGNSEIKYPKEFTVDGVDFRFSLNSSTHVKGKHLTTGTEHWIIANKPIFKGEGASHRIASGQLNKSVILNGIKYSINSLKSNADLLGDNTAAKQAIADAVRTKDAKRNSGEDNASDFNLSGSDSEADKAIASGAQALFSRADSNNQTDTPAFKKWFGGSKVVDKNGNPLVVYHGTDKAFYKVNMKKGAQGLFWFTSDKSAIESGEVGAAGNGVIMEMYAKIENPAGWKEYDKFGVDELVARGYDGVILPESDGSFVGFIFEPNQVKSATKNNGNFDPANNDIRFSRSAMKSVDANAERGESAMNEALLSKAVVKRAMYHNELGWIDFVWGNDFKGIQHIIKQRMVKDGLNTNDVYKLLTKDLVETIASGEVIRNTSTENSLRLVIKGKDNEAVLVKTKGSNGWLLTGFKLNEQMNQSGGATTSSLRSTETIRSRYSEVAVQSELYTLARDNVNSASFNRNNQPTFYSALTRAIENIQTKKADPIMWKGLIKNLAQKGVKPDEIEWTGINEWLALQTGVVTKEQVLDYLDSNGVQVGEVVKSKTSGKLTVADVKAAIANDIYGQEVDVYQSMADAPMYVQVQAKSEGASGIEGFFDGKTNRVALIANNLPDAKRAVEVARHELIGHYGMENMLGKEVFARITKGVTQGLNLGNKTYKELADYVLDSQSGLIINSDDSASAKIEKKNRLAREIIAVMAERGLHANPKYINNSLIKQIIDRVRLFLKKLGFIKAEITDKELSILLRDAQVYLKAQGRSIATPSDISFSATAQTNTPAFKKWFGESKIVDKQGVPLIAYHGTGGNFDSFNTNKEGQFGKGAYFTNLPSYASGFANNSFYTRDAKNQAKPNVIPVYLSLQNPYILKGSDPVPKASYLKKNKHDGIMYFGGVGADGREYNEYVAFNPNQIKSAIGNNGNFDGNNDDISFSRQGSLTPQWDDLNDSKLDKIIRVLQDKNIDLKRVQKQITQNMGEIADRFNAYLQEELFHKRSAKRTESFVKKELDPLITDMRMRKVELADFEEYVWMRHAPERNAKMAEINEGNPDGLAGVSTEEAQQYMGELTPAQRKNYEALAKRLDAMTAKTLDTLVAYALESQATVNSWKADYQYYVPLMREDMDIGQGNGTGQGYKVKGSSVKQATGSRRNVVDILANVAQARERAIIRGEKNRVVTALIGLVKTAPNDAFWKAETPPTITTTNKVTGFVETYTDPNYKSREDVLVARIADKQGNIQERSVTFNKYDERAMNIARSLLSLDVDQMGVFLTTAAVGTRWISSVNTQYNPIFGLWNLWRDAQAVMLNLGSTPLAGKQKEVMAVARRDMVEIFKDIRSNRNGIETNSEIGILFEELQLEGGTTGYRDMFNNAKERSKALEHALDPTWWAKSPLGKVLTLNGFATVPIQYTIDAKYGVKGLFDLLSDYNTTLENVMRLAVYKVALDNGQSKQKAASLAKNISVNFNRKGTIGREAGALYAFFNASLQGTARMAETLFKDGKLSAMGKKVVYGGLLLGSAQALILAMAGFEEDEPADFIKNRNIVIPIGDGEYVTWALPLGFNAIPAMGRLATEFALSGGKDGTQKLSHAIEVLLDMFNPIGNAGMSLQTLAPSVLDPAVALLENRNWNGLPIYKEDFNSLDPSPGHTRAKDTATALSKGLAYGLNAVTGGDEDLPGAFSPTPDQIDYLIGQVTGGVGREISKTEQTITSVITGEELPTYKIPLFGRLYGETKGSTAQGSKFYENLMEMNKHDRKIDALVERDEDVDAYIAEHPEAELTQYTKKVYSQINKLRKMRKQLKTENANMTELKEIDDEITGLMQEINDEIKLVKDAA